MFPNRMSKDGASKLAKVLAYLGSDKDGEVLAALRASRRIMAAEGVSLESALIGSVAAEREEGSNLSADPLLQIHIRDLQARIAHLEAEKTVLADDLARKAEECEGWRNLAWRNRKLSGSTAR